MARLIAVLCAGAWLAAAGNPRPARLPSAEEVSADAGCATPHPRDWLYDRDPKWKEIRQSAPFRETLAGLKRCRAGDLRCLRPFLSRCFSTDDLALFNKGVLAGCLSDPSTPAISKDGSFVALGDGRSVDANLSLEKGGWRLHSFQVYGH